MFNLVIGGFVALFFLGLPLAIIALFIAGSLEKKPRVSERHGHAVDAPPTADRAADYRRDMRRRVVYGGHAAIATKPADREKSVRLQSPKV